MAKQDDAPGLTPGTRCYIPDDARIWLPATVESVDLQQGTATVVIEHDDDDDTNDNGDERRTLSNTDGACFPLQNTQGVGPDGYDDMIELNHLHEAAILYNIMKRFRRRLPYTFTGEICLALNPYQWLEELYEPKLHTKYLRAPSRKALPPHVYAISVAAYRHMRQHGQNQSILVSGESGAGKTETTKILMDNLATITSGAQQETIDRIIQVNPLLESFGNAKTKRNDNSSRFGKFTQLQFDDKHVLCGAKCETYLLEKTRVITQDAGERNYHIFYQLLYGATSEERDSHGLLESPRDYAYLIEDPKDKALQKKDIKNFAQTKRALGLLGLSDTQQSALFQVLSGILHLGQIDFEAKPGNDEASQAVLATLSCASQLLGLAPGDMDKALCSRTMKAGGEVYAVPLQAEQARSCRDALAKAVYANVFEWMVKQINGRLSAEGDTTNAIGVLDIFGFESFVHNSFEQLCINYANEKLQQKFTQDVFKAVQEEYEQEGITWDHIEYADNADVLALIDGKLGIISLLNEEVVRPKGNDESFVGKLASSFRQKKQIIEFPRTSRTQFAIHHYAERVQYEAVGFLDKHKDALLPDLEELMRASEEAFVAELFTKKVEAAPAAAPAAGPPRRKFGKAAEGGGSSATVGTQFKQSLHALMTTINQTNVNYIRCIKPNRNKSSTKLDERMVVNQLRCAGVIEAISIARAGYPNRMPHAEFANEFDLFLPPDALETQSAGANCNALVKHFELKVPDEVQMGQTKIYLQLGVLERLEGAKAKKLFAYVACIQSAWRGLVTRRWVAQLWLAVALLQRRGRGFVARIRFTRMRIAAADVQRVWRGHQGRQIAHERCRQRSALVVQCRVRCFLARLELARRVEARRREEALQRLRNHSAKVIQRHARGRLARAAFAVLKQLDADERQRQLELQRKLELRRQVSAALIQKYVRGRMARVVFAVMLEQAREKRRQQAAAVIQRHARGRLARVAFAALREEQRQLHAVVQLQRVARGRLARRQVASMGANARDGPEWKAAFDENQRLKQHLSELLEVNIELESLVSELHYDRDVVTASQNVQVLDLKQQITNQQQAIETATTEHDKLRRYIEQSPSRPRGFSKVGTQALKQSLDLKSGLHSPTLSPENDVDVESERSSLRSTASSSIERPSMFRGNVSSFLQRPSFLKKPDLGASFQQRKTGSAKLLRAGAQKLGRAKSWVKSNSRRSNFSWK
ncbi:TPA: hypothetical protein N0F65_002055 [Lagenidium giganteum]|uniref:Myosin motor domain-containing protein n=1 Tax=Lagenidium giganteum TaxID=4803 RepID=A0AAV2ZHL6_9STRA|nr:TPA: hypothetical protein N0F65_002055 [Lagenidium giganteum]